MGTKEQYYKKLFDPRWRAKRIQIIERDNHTCQKCKVEIVDYEKGEFDECYEDRLKLEVHHINYNGEPWQAKDEDLITLCDYCHDFVEYIKNSEGHNMTSEEIKNYSFREKCNTGYVKWF